MRIAQIVLPGASEYERKSQRCDHAALSAAHEVVVTTLDRIRDAKADVAHVYASGELPSSAFVRFPLPYVSSADVRRSRWAWRRPVEPHYVVSPIIEKVDESRHQPLAEAVEEHYFASGGQALLPVPSGLHAFTGGTGRSACPPLRRVSSFARPQLANIVEQTVARIGRFRDDVTWQLIDHVPTPEDLASVDVWVDPAIDESDFDGFVAEALVVGVPVVASRTKVNTMRLEHGRTGLLVPPRDPNELTHAILAALFKPEVAASKSSAARQTASKFKCKQRLRVLTQMYDTLTP